MTDRRGFLGWLGMLAGWQSHEWPPNFEGPRASECKEGEERCRACGKCQVPRIVWLGEYSADPHATLEKWQPLLFEEHFCSECGVGYVPKEGK